MPKKIDVETKDKAIQLRKSGASYASISEKLGVSTRWCKEHLSNIESSSDTKFKDLLKRSKSQKGVTVSEVASTISREGISEKQFYNKLRNTVAKIRSESKDNIIRQDWVVPSFAEELNNMMLIKISELDSRIQKDAELLFNELTKSHPDKFDKGEIPSVFKIKQKIVKSLNNTYNLHEACQFFKSRNGEHYE
jgi:intergrase/recombinase